MNDDNFIPDDGLEPQPPVSPSPQPFSEQPQSLGSQPPLEQYQPITEQPQPVTEQFQQTTEQPQQIVEQSQPVTEQFQSYLEQPQGQPLPVEPPIDNFVAPMELPKKQNLPLLPVILAAVVGVIAIVAVVLLFVNRGGGGYSISATSVRNVCDKYGLTIREETVDKATMITCSANTQSGSSIAGIGYLKAEDGSLDDYRDYISILDSVEEEAINLEGAGEFKKYYVDGVSLGVGGETVYIIVGNDACVIILGNDDDVRAALIEMGCPDRNWATSSIKQSQRDNNYNSRFAMQRDTARRNDMSRVDTSLVQYQINHNTNSNNLPNLGTSAVSWTATANFPSYDCNIACAFVRDYINTSTSRPNSPNEFADPDGALYNVVITPNWGIYPDAVSTSVVYNSNSRLVAGEVTGSFTIGGNSPLSEHVIYIVLGGRGSGSGVVKSGKRHFAILYRFESAGVYCIDDQ